MTKLITWDLGGTKCAAGLIDYDVNTQIFDCVASSSIKLSDTRSLTDLIEQTEQALNHSMSEAAAICIGAAGVYDGQCLTLEQAYPYVMNFADIAVQRHWPKFDVIHDYSPIVCATFTSYMDNPNHVKRLNQAVGNPYGRRIAIGVGTGLGMKDGVLLDNGDFWLGRNEGGHIGICVPPITHTAYEWQRHLDLMNFLRSQDDTPDTFQKILSGHGTSRMYEFFHPGQKDLHPEDIGALMRSGQAPETADAFAWYLGLFVGTMQLTFMPEGGVWLAGGVALLHMDLFDTPAFQAGLDASPAYALQRQQFPLGVLCQHDNALIGGAYYAVKRLLK